MIGTKVVSVTSDEGFLFYTVYFTMLNRDDVTL